MNVDCCLNPFEFIKESKGTNRNSKLCSFKRTQREAKEEF